MENEFKTIKIVYAGTRFINGKRGFYYHPFPNWQKDTFAFKTLLLTGLSIGTVLETTTNGKVFKKHKVSEEQFTDKENITRWSLKDRAAKEEYSMYSIAKKQKGGDIEELINQIKDAMWTMDSRERARVARYVFEKLI